MRASWRVFATMSTRVTRSASRPSLAAAPAQTIVAPNGAKKGGTKRSATKASSAEGSGKVDMPPPDTPVAKRPRKSKTAQNTNGTSREEDVPSTPTPTGAKLMSGLATPKGRAALPPPKSSPSKALRPADPHATNAPLSTPGGTKHVAYRKSVSPSPSMPRPTSTTADLLQKGCAHLRAMDPRLNPVIDAYPCPLWTPEALAEPVDPFKALVSSILAQQVSGAAAASIQKKFVGLWISEEKVAEDRKAFPSSEQVAKADLATLRTAGLSGRKAEYVKGLAEKFASGELSAKWLVEASWEELYEKLIAVRGLGQWSVEMFACFALKRMDIFSTGDLGVQRGLAALVGKDVKKLKAKGGGKWKYMSEKEMLEHSEKFAPYRSLLMWYLWRIEDVDVNALQGG